MNTEITPGLEPGAIQESTSDIISPEPTMPELSEKDEITIALRHLAESEPDSLAEKLGLQNINILYKKKVGIKLLTEEYKFIKDAYLKEKAAKLIPEPTEEELKAMEQAYQAEKEEQERIEKAQQAEQERIQRFVKDLQQESDLLPIFHKLLEQSGYICNLLTATILFLSHGARLLSNCMAFHFTGASASGKTEGIIKASKLLPPEVVKNYTSFSDQAIYHLGNIAHYYLILGEVSPPVHGQEDKDDYKQSAIRQLLSDGKITRGSVEKTDGKTNQLADKMTEGPCVIMATTTKEPNNFNDELQNRTVWAPSDGSQETTSMVLDSQADAAENPIKEDDAELALKIAAFQELNRTLEPMLVKVPFGRFIKPSDHHVTARRLNPMLLNLTRSSALMHQHCREKQMKLGRLIIVATLEDYKAAYIVATAGAPRVLELCPPNALKAFDKIVKPEFGNKDTLLTKSQLLQLIDEPESTVYRWLRDYVKSGLLNEYRNGRLYTYTLGDGKAGGQELGLISPEVVEQRMQLCGGVVL